MKLTRKSSFRKQKPARGASRKRRLGVEPLEDRRLLAFGDPIVNVQGLSLDPDAELPIPPDTSGDIGKEYFIQSVNGTGTSLGGGSEFAIYDKEDGSLVRGPMFMGDFAVDQECQSGSGDPIILYDHLAERWFLSEFYGLPGADDVGVCLYVSQTSDPTADLWHQYSFETQFFPDYPKFSVWEDGYYMTTNENDGGLPNPSVYVFDRENMLQGAEARPYQRFTPQALLGYGFQALTPADIDGALLHPAGAGNYALRHVDDERVFGVTDGSVVTDQDYIEVFETRVNFEEPRLSTFGIHSVVPMPDFDSLMCNAALDCIPQPGTDQGLDAVADIIMQRLQYRNFGTHETIVGNFTIDVHRSDVDETNRAGIRWFEFRKEGGSGWILHQHGDIAPPDNNHRWMGAAAMDGNGNIAVGYNISGPAQSPSLRYTGRLADDPIGMMLQGEHAIVNGRGSQVTGDRFGDYSQLGIDPVDDTTFWFTGEYIDNGPWATQITSFAFPPPPPPPPAPELPGPGTISGTKYVDLDGDGIQDPNEPGLEGIFIYIDEDNDGRIALEEPKAITDENGEYIIPVDINGTYIVREVATPGYIQTQPGSPNFGYTVNVGPGAAVTGIDFGNEPAVDFGDLAGYPTTLAEGGPSHGILTGFSLGTEVDAEANGQPDSAALGDDSNGIFDDEDGITLPSTLRSGEDFTVTAVVSLGTASSGYLQGFIDFNNNGSFNDPGEQIITDALLGAGTHQIGPISVPDTVAPGNVGARFRYSHRAGLSSEGPAIDGEVEDYQVQLIANEPVANADNFTVNQGDQSVILNVLANDLPSTISPNEIIPPPGQSSIVGSAGGLIQIGPDKTEIFYTPVASFAGTETFVYGITDTDGNTDTALVSVNVVAATADPIAVDDMFPDTVFTIPASTPVNARPEYTLDVLANDLDGQSGAAILGSISVPPANGTARIENGVIIYQPNLDFDDFDQLSYRLVGSATDPDLEATVSIQVQPDADNNDRAQFIVRPLVSSVEVGEQFQVEVQTRDIRVPPAGDAGVAAAYLDLLYDASLVSVVPDGTNPRGFDIDFSGPYGSAASGDALTLGVLNEVGATQNATSGSVGPGPQTLFVVTFTANAPGTAEFFSDPADESPRSDVVVLDPVEVIDHNEITFFSGSVTITAPAGGGEGELGRHHNNFMPADVDLDDHVSPMDAALTINSLNNFGSRKLDFDGEGEIGPAFKFDVNNDGFLTPIDALTIIEHLNRSAEGEGEFVAAAPVVDEPVADNSPNLALGTVEVYASLINDADARIEQPLVQEEDEELFAVGPALATNDPFANDLDELVTVEDEETLDDLAADIAEIWSDDLS